MVVVPALQAIVPADDPGTGVGFTVTVDVVPAVELQPLLSVTVTLYIPEPPTGMDRYVAEENDPDEEKPPGPVQE